VTPKRSVRPRARLLVGLAFIAALVVAGLVLGLNFGRHHEPAATTTVTTGQATRVVIPEGASAQHVAEILREQGIVDSASDFLDAVEAQGAATRLKPGTYELVPGQSYGSVIDKLEKGEVSPELKLTIPEGLAIDQTAERLKTQGRLDGSMYAKLAKQPKDFSVPAVGDSVPKVTSLEGLLFPSTYALDESDGPTELIQDQLKAFTQHTATLPWQNAADLGVTPYQVLIIASMVEKEASLASERPLVAAVIYNRLAKKMPLQIDATTRYALKKWTGALTESDLASNSPYNTRSKPGLPPGPIASPGVAALEAALTPAKVDYLYYVLVDEEGHHFFTASYQEFLEAKDGSPAP
jgi:UPF0755 protein